MCHGPQSYAQLVAKLWKDGETFAIVEDDIAPWPGAIKQLLACPRHWCGFHYALPGRWDVEDTGPYKSLWGTTGCFKVDSDVMRAAPELYIRWDTHDWRMFDSAFMSAMRHVMGLEASPPEHTFHVHKPAVAHAMHYRPEASNGRGSQADTHPLSDPVSV